jgi:hypothetical protein
MTATRAITRNGAVLDRFWYCSAACLEEGLEDDPPGETIGEPESVTERSHYPHACAICGEPACNPLTEQGLATVAEWLAADLNGGWAQACASAYGITLPAMDTLG